MQFFDELPEGRRTVRSEPVDWEQAKATLIENPGKWGLMADNVPASTPGQLRKGKNRLFRGPELEHFEFRVRKPEGAKYPPRRTDLYGRFTPAEGEE